MTNDFCMVEYIIDLFDIIKQMNKDFQNNIQRYINCTTELHKFTQNLRQQFGDSVQIIGLITEYIHMIQKDGLVQILELL